ncbi:hypothetical protein, partial [Odoribacter laneus]|uniref:hypothetical protein n=1 Tax=Odoribacter laneus TaxID=626933 RepID=UPI003AF6E62B
TVRLPDKITLSPVISLSRNKAPASNTGTLRKHLKKRRGEDLAGIGGCLCFSVIAGRSVFLCESGV